MLLLLAWWCGSYEGWRFLAADWALGTILTVCSGSMTAAKLVLADLLENVACRFPSMRLWSAVGGISVHSKFSSNGNSCHTQSGFFAYQSLSKLNLLLSARKSKVLLDGPDQDRDSGAAAES